MNVTRYDLQPVPQPKAGDAELFRFDTYAEIRAQVSTVVITAEIRRLTSWDPMEGGPTEVAFEAHIDGLPETAGCADIIANAPELLALATVATRAAELLQEAASA